MAIFMSTFLNISDRMLYYLLHDNVAGHQVFFTIYFLWNASSELSALPLKRT